MTTQPLLGCPWDGNQPKLYVERRGMRDEPYTVVLYRCSCGAERRVVVTDTPLEAAARKVTGPRLLTWHEQCVIAAEPTVRSRWNTRVQP